MMFHSPSADWFACYSPAMDKYIISQPIEGEMNSRWMPDSLAYMWNFSGFFRRSPLS